MAPSEISSILSLLAPLLIAVAASPRVVRDRAVHAASARAIGQTTTRIPTWIAHDGAYELVARDVHDIAVLQPQVEREFAAYQAAFGDVPPRVQIVVEHRRADPPMHDDDALTAAEGMERVMLRVDHDARLFGDGRAAITRPLVEAWLSMRARARIGGASQVSAAAVESFLGLSIDTTRATTRMWRLASADRIRSPNELLRVVRVPDAARDAATWSAQTRALAYYLSQREGSRFVGTLIDAQLSGTTFADVLASAPSLPHDATQLDIEWRQWVDAVR